VTESAAQNFPQEAFPWITARCARCHRIAAKYWENNAGRGHWKTPQTTPATVARFLIADRLCQCDPPPTLPEGDELAALLSSAKTGAPGRRRNTPLTIRVQ
jgi:hypothetical protein